MIYVSSISTTGEGKGVAENLDETELKVHINDKLSKINDMYLHDGTSGYIVS